MSTLSVEELILDPVQYAEVRKERRAAAIALRGERRVPLGDLVVVEFETGATLQFQAQEMIYVERITDPGRAAEELAVYERLLPGGTTLTATLLIEIADQEVVRSELARLDGLHRSIQFVAGDRSIPAREIPPPDEGPSLRTVSVHFLAFDLEDAAVRAMHDGQRVAVHADHPAYQAVTELSPRLVDRLLADLDHADQA